MRATGGSGLENLERSYIQRNRRRAWNFAEHGRIAVPIRLDQFEENSATAMNYSELESELRKLRPAQPSPVLFERVGEALENCREGIKERRSLGRRWSGLETAHPWWSLGFGLAAAAVLILLAAVTMERRYETQQTVAQTSAATEARPAPLRTEPSTARSKFVPAGGTNVVYNARDEGLHFADGSERPVRRVRYHTQQTWRWRNPETGASLRVSYPSEEIVLIPVSGQ